MPNTEVFAFIPRCKIQGEFYKRISDFASVVGMTRGQIDTYKYRHHHKNMIEALQEMQKDRIPAYKTEKPQPHDRRYDFSFPSIKIFIRNMKDLSKCF